MSSSGGSDLERLVLGADIDEIVAAADRLADAGDWEQLVRLRRLCRAALESGRQLWPAATWSAYLIALDGPAPLAAQALSWGEDRFAPGPLSEVVAQNHSWAELVHHTNGDPVWAVIAHERVIRGEALTGLPMPSVDVFGIPLERAGWEPEWSTPRYSHEGLVRPEHPPVALPPMAELGAADATGPGPEDDGVAGALAAALEHWQTESTGRVSVTAAEGGAEAAIRALGIGRARIAAVDTADALDRLFVAAADGAALGRRRGGAWARASVWWFLQEVAGSEETDEVLAAAHGLDAFVWDAGEPVTGWHLRLVFADRRDGWAWAITATDQRLAAGGDARSGDFGES